MLPKSTTQSSASTPDETRKHKSVTLPPSKPPRLLSENDPEAAPPAKVDEWEQKLYGKHLDIGSTDSLKRRSWESSRVMLSVQQEEDEDQHQKKAPQEAPPPVPTSVTAPTSPMLTDKSSKEDSEGYDKPKPLPRVGSQDISKVSDKLIINNAPITSNSMSNSRKSINQPSPKLEKQDSSSFTKKLKHFIKDHRAESMENLSGSRKQLNGTKHHVNERIIIGGENGSNGTGDLPMAFLTARQSKLVTEVSPEILAKYEGKTREDMMKIAHNLENEVSYQKQKVKELEDYLDSLLLKVMECQPRILQNPYQKANPTKSLKLSQSRPARRNIFNRRRRKSIFIPAAATSSASRH
ncbi:AAEL005271-PA [Aedes aegypti]|uniref:AAEL005271-PA n=1 Tax=Aedes aegypti TaxID=7159 RepID=Q17AJ4_AEDAE|nr:AAEL005271-PA [Aedes aegypti]